MAESLEQSIHTSVYDRIQAEKGKEIASAAFDLVPISHEESVAQRRKSLAQQRHDLKAKKKSTAKRVPRDSWLAPLSFSVRGQSNDPQVHRDGLRASDKDFFASTGAATRSCSVGLQRTSLESLEPVPCPSR